MIRKISLMVTLSFITHCLFPPLTRSQDITIDGNTATIVTKNGDRIVIDGNTLSRDGKNLFHSFQEFGLTSQQIATFLTNPNIQNILTRVTGGNPSYINGLIEVVGGNSNLFLMNPAGIVFGSGASLNVPADFTATTATGIGFSNGILNALGSNDYQNFIGNPTNFVFNNNQSGSIINAGDLKVANGSNINLIGGNVVNTGMMETAQGKINIQAVKGTSRIKITPEGSLLSLELDIPKDEQGNLLGFTPQDLPTLLTGANNANIITSNITVIDSQVKVGNTNIPNEAGIAIASGKISTSSENQGGYVTVLGDKVGVIDGEIEANGVLGGGKILIGGDRQGQGTIPNAQITIVNENSSIKADATVDGKGGEVIIFAENHSSIHGELTAKGGEISGNGGFIETSGLKSFNISSVPDVSAINGKGGEWLIDPYDITIINNQVIGDTIAGITETNPFVAFRNSALLWVDLIRQALSDGDVTISTGIGSDTGFPQEGNIIWNSDTILDYDNINDGRTLTLNAANNIIYLGIINDSIPSTTNSLNLVFNADSDNNQLGAIVLLNNSLINTNTGNIDINAKNSATAGINSGFEIIGNGSIITSGVTTFNNAQTNIIIPQTSPSDFNTIVINSAGNVNLYDVNSLNLGNSNINGNLAVTTNGNITNSGVITVAGETTLNPNNADIILDNITNDFNILRVFNGNNLTLTDVNDLVLADIIVNNNLNMRVGNSLTQIPSPLGINVLGTTVLDATPQGEINLLGNNNDFNVLSVVTANNFSLVDVGNLNLSNTNINGNFTLTTSGNINNSGVVTVAGETTLNTNNADIILNDIANDFNILKVFNGNNVTLTDVNSLNLGNSNINGNLTLTTNGNINNSGVVTVAGETTLNPNNADIILNDIANDFNILRVFNGNNVTLTDVNSLNLSNSNINGNLTLTTNGNITNSGVVTVAGETTLNPNNADIILDNIANDFNFVSINDGNNVILTDVNDLTLGNVDSFGNPLNINISGDLDLRVSAITNILSNIQANSIVTDNIGITSLNANSITTTGNQTYNNQVNIERNNTLSSGNGQLNFNGVVNVSENLTLESFSGINFPNNAIVSANGSDLTLKTLNNDRSISINGINPISFNLSNLDQINGFNKIIIGESNSIGSININGVLNINDPIILQASNINIKFPIIGNDDASINIKGAKTTTILNADILTQGNDIIIDDNVILGADVTLATDSVSTVSGKIDILGSINGNQNLTLNAGNNNILILGSLGNNQSLNNLTVTANTTNLDGGFVSTTGNQIFNSDLSLATNTIFQPQGFFVSDNITTNGNDVSIVAENINTANIDTNNLSGNGGNITLTSTQDAIVTQNIDSSGNSAGAIALNSATKIETQTIKATGNSGNGGNVTINAVNDIQSTSINTRSNNATGGNVNIQTKGRLRITNTIDSTNFSIDSSGDNGGGSININLFPDAGPQNREDSRFPFIVGDSSNNGTLGLITTGDFTLAQGEYFDTFQLGNIGFVLLDPQPETPEPEIPEPETPEPETPEPETPEPEIPEPEIPEPETPEPEIPEPETPEPETPEPEIPEPETPINSTQEKLNQLKKEGDINNAIPIRLETKNMSVNPYAPVIPIATIAQAQEILSLIEEETAEKPALIYVTFTPKGYQPPSFDEDFARREATNTQEYSQVDINLPNLQPNIALKPASEDQLDLLIITRKGAPIRLTVPVTREQVVQSATKLWSSASDNFALNDNYKPYATELYSWLITPLEDKLKKEEISNLLFILPTEIRFIPLAALYDGDSQQFLVEKYSSGLAPSLNLNDNSYRPMKDLSLLAMGASQFADSKVAPLPAVSLELPTIQKIWNGEQNEDYQRYLNSNFTFEGIKQNLATKPFGIVHFGTHGEFNPTDTTDSFIQLYNSHLKLNELRTLGLNQPLVELMVLSACDTAFGNDVAELGFAGLAVHAGVKTSLGSVWQVSDTGTLALMTDFYGQLKIQSTKAESLRQTQLNMLKGKVYKTKDGNTIVTPELRLPLDQLPENSRLKEDFSHPFYWAPFTMIGNPW